jgi:hypothetical protein
VSKHLGTQRRLNPCTLFLCFWSSKNICSPSPSTSNIKKIAQFHKRMGKIWGVWWKGVQGLMISELQHIKILSLKSSILYFCLQKTNKFYKALVGTPIRFLITQNKRERYEAITKEGSKDIFSNLLKQTITCPLYVFSGLLLYICHSKNLCNPLVCVSNDTKITQFG